MFPAPISLTRVGFGSLPEMKMRPLSASDELKELLARTEQCATQARVAQQQARRFAQQYRVNAEEFGKLAARSGLAEIRTQLLRIAASYERLCTISEGTDAIAHTEVRPVPRKPPYAAATRRTEDPVSQARRHIAEGEASVERQEALVARLSDSNKYLSLAGQARQILGTLKQTLRLARDHLEYELRK
jgi:hypothetical protein